MQEHRQLIKPILEAVAASMQYPHDSPAVEPTSEPEKAEWEETAEMLSERRQELFVLFKNLARLSPDQAGAFLGTQLQQKLSPSASFAVGAFTYRIDPIPPSPFAHPPPKLKQLTVSPK